MPGETPSPDSFRGGGLAFHMFVASKDMGGALGLLFPLLEFAAVGESGLLRVFQKRQFNAQE